MAIYAACTINLASEAIKVRWQEPYVTSGLNQKTLGQQAKGVFAGFTVVPGPTGTLKVLLQVDPTLGFSGANVLDVTTSKYCVTVIQSSTVTVDLASVANGTVYLALDAQYQIGAASGAQVKVVDAAELAINSNLVLLAKVNVPAIPDILTSHINMGYRLSAGDSITPESRPSLNLLLNGSFERDSVGLAPASWALSVLGAFVQVVASGVARTGVNCLQLIGYSAPSGDVASSSIVVTPGRSYRAGGWFRSIGGGITGAGVGLQLRVAWYNALGVLISTTDIEAPFKSAVTVYEERKSVVTAPTGATTAKIVINIDGCLGTAFFDDGEFSSRTLESSSDMAASYAGGPAWADSTPNPETTVEAQLDKIISDLAGASGAAKIGNAPSKILANTFSQINTFSTPSASNQAVIVKASAAQTANVLEVQDSTAAVLTAIDKDGDLVFSTAARQLAWPDWHLTEKDSVEARLLPTGQPSSHVDFLNIPVGVTQSTSVFATNTTGTSVGVSARADGTNWLAGSAHPIYVAPDAAPEWSFEVGGVLASINKTRIANIARPTTAADSVSTEYLHETVKQKNSLLNSGFDFWQRGPTVAISHSSGANVWNRNYGADRWYVAATSATAASGVFGLATRFAATGGLTNTKYETAFGTAFPPQAYSVRLVQEVDRTEVLRLRGKTINVSAWLYNAGFAAGITYELKLVSGTGADTEIVSGYTGTVATVATTGALNVNTLSGTTFARKFAQGVVGATVTTLAVVIEVVGPSGIGGSGTIRVAQAMLSESVSTLIPPWDRQHESQQAELLACQAFYEKSYALETVPGTTPTLADAEYNMLDTGQNPTKVHFRVVKPKVPVLTFYSASAATSRWSHGAGTSAVASLASSTTGFTPDLTGVPDAAPAGYRIFGHWTADADI